MKKITICFVTKRERGNKIEIQSIGIHFSGYQRLGSKFFLFTFNKTIGCEIVIMRKKQPLR